MTTPQTPSAPQPATLPVVRLLPKANARAIRHGFPWVYANELVTDRRTRRLEPGSLAVLQDSDREDLGVGQLEFFRGRQHRGNVMDAVILAMGLAVSPSQFDQCAGARHGEMVRSPEGDTRPRAGGRQDHPLSS